MHRRTLLTALAQLPLLGLASHASAAEVSLRPRLKSMSQDELGTTLMLGLPEAPFAGLGHGDDTVIVFVPKRYRYREGEGVATLVHYHGHNTSAERALVAHALREQLVESRQNAVLIVPQLALLAPDSSCGRLALRRGLARLVGSALSSSARVGRRSLGDARFPEQAPLGRVCISAHSGGYHAAACSLREGGVDVSETYLFDALYAEMQSVLSSEITCPGDGNQDLLVDEQDVENWQFFSGFTGEAASSWYDFNHDGLTNELDLEVIEDNLGTSCRPG